MKTPKTLFVIIILALSCVISYNLGKATSDLEHTKDYQVASIMTTCCNNMIDNLGVDAEEIYYDYIDNLDCYNFSITKEDIDRYNSWH